MAKVRLLDNNFKKWTASLDGINAGYTYAEILEVIEAVVNRVIKQAPQVYCRTELKEDMYTARIACMSEQSFGKKLTTIKNAVAKIEGMFCEREGTGRYAVLDANRGDLFGMLSMHTVTLQSGSKVPVLCIDLTPNYY